MIGDVDDLKICTPRYLGTTAGDGRSMATIRSRMDEWLRHHRYHHEVELEAPEGAPVETRSAYLLKFAWHPSLSGMCQKVHQVKCTTTIVQTSGYSNGQAMFLIVGCPGRKPPPESLNILID